MKKEKTIVLLFSFLWCGLIVVAPVIAPNTGTEKLISKGIYSFFSVICHQFDSRCFHIDGYPFAVCIRCSAIYFSFFIGIAASQFSRFRSALDFRNQETIGLIIISLPMFIDAMLDMFGIFSSSTFSRIVTGGIFGLGISIILFQTLLETIQILIHSFSRLKNYAFNTR